MPLKLHHHPFTRAASVVWMLEEVGEPYELVYMDLLEGEHKREEFKAHNPMGKLPTLIDGDVVVTESAAIAMYLADRYAPGRLAPALEAPERGTYYRWITYAPSVIEPGCLAKAAKWEYRAPQAGWGNYEDMLDTITAAIGEGPWLLGERFSMADVVFGGTVGWMTMFGMLDKRPEYMAYVERLHEREAWKKSRAINDAIVAERGLERRAR
jgi:glutathione S-transferase